MSIQAGILFFDGTRADRELLPRTLTGLSILGGESETTYLQNSIGMLYRSFHTTSESRLENQPFISQEGLIITWDGRLDNRDEFVRELGESFRSKPDVSIIAAGLDRWGEHCFSKIVGDWALAIWNPHQRMLLLGRDFAGIRPLYYSQQATSISWSTDLASLVLGRRNLTLSSEYIAGYLTMWPASDLTPYREVNSVPAGHLVRVSKDGISQYGYWNFDHASTIRYKSDGQYEEHFRFLFRQSVRRRVRTDCPLLAELSGGLDSSAIVCMADDLIARQEIAPLRLDTFSYYDRAEPDEDDFHYFTKVEDQRGRTGHRAELRSCGDSLRLKYEDFLPTPGFGARQEIQAALTNVVTRHNYRVMLSGVGGDELLGQAFDPRVQMADLLVRGRLQALAKQVISWSVLMRRPWYLVLWETMMLLLPVRMRTKLAGGKSEQPWIEENFYTTHKLPYRLLLAAEGHWFWLPSRRDSFQTLATLSRQATFTKPFIAERRYPYLDQNLAEFLSRIPVEQLIRPADRRSLMRRSLKSIVPPEILARKTKSAEGRCYSITLNKHWSEIEQLLKSPLISEAGYIKRDEFRQALVDMRAGNLSPHYVRLLRALSLEVWLRDVVERGVISRPGSPEISPEEYARECQAIA